jgi:hypothetical protein
VARARRVLTGLLCLTAVAGACGGDLGSTEQTLIVSETMSAVFPETGYSIVTDAVLCPDEGRRVTVVASFIVPGVPQDTVSAVKSYWAERGDLTERVTRSRWTESAMSESIVTFTQSQDGRTAEVLAFANDCDARKMDRLTEQVDPQANS